MVMGDPELDEISRVGALDFQWVLNFFSKFREVNLKHARVGVFGSAGDDVW